MKNLPNYNYPSNYNGIKEAEEQVEILCKTWPKLKPKTALNYYHKKYTQLNLPLHVEGALFLPRPGFFGNSYISTLKKVFSVLKKQREFELEEFDEKRFKEPSKQIEAHFERIFRIQPGETNDLLVIPVQLGLCYKGRSGKQMDEFLSYLDQPELYPFKGPGELHQPIEYGFSTYMGAIALFTHPDRLENYGDLDITCTADVQEYWVESEGTWFSNDDGYWASAHPSFCINDDGNLFYGLAIYQQACGENGPATFISFPP